MEWLTWEAATLLHSCSALLGQQVLDVTDLSQVWLHAWSHMHSTQSTKLAN